MDSRICARGGRRRLNGDKMAKGKYVEWTTEDGLVLLQGWARDGLTDEQIAHNIGIHVGTLYAWKNRHPEIDEALKKGKEVVDYEVENALLRKALSGDVTAQIYWLKNRRPKKWRDKQETQTDFDTLAKVDKILVGISEIARTRN